MAGQTPLLIAAGIAMLALPLLAQEAADHAPGLAAKYRGDVGIEEDPAVVFVEDFEGGSLDDVVERWTAASKTMALVKEGPAGTPGSQAMEMTATRGESTGGSLYKTFSPGYDQLYARFYVKFAADCGYIHHFVFMGGLADLKPWPVTKAGVRPAGDEGFSVGMEPTGSRDRYPPPGAWRPYVYWCEMRQSSDGRYWGNAMEPAHPAPAARGQWMCVECMIKCNTPPDQRDGELLLWLDGKQVIRLARGVRRSPGSRPHFHLVEQGGEPFEGFLWRTTDRLKVNYFRLLHYVTDRVFASTEKYKKEHPEVAVDTEEATVWFDHVVIATEYIGPMVPVADPGSKAR